MLYMLIAFRVLPEVEYCKNVYMNTNSIHIYSYLLIFVCRKTVCTIINVQSISLAVRAHNQNRIVIVDS